MKPVHAGLLIVGAALAGGLAIEMTEPQPIPVAPVPASIEVRQVAPAGTAGPRSALKSRSGQAFALADRKEGRRLPRAGFYEEPGRVQIEKTPYWQQSPPCTRQRPTPAHSEFHAEKPAAAILRCPLSLHGPEPKAQPHRPKPKISPRS